MSKLKMPLPYLSCSAFMLYERDPMEYYEQYFVARVQEVSDPMTLGTIFQEAWCDPKYDYKKKLREAGFDPDKERAFKNALTHETTVILPKKKTEKRVDIQGLGLLYPIIAIFDGIDEDIDLIVENKWGIPWTKQRVETGIFYNHKRQKQKNRQITWYTLVYYLKTNRLPKFLLQSFNGKNGIPNKFWVKKTMKELHELVREINIMVERVKSGDFNKYV